MRLLLGGISGGKSKVPNPHETSAKMATACWSSSRSYVRNIWGEGGRRTPSHATCVVWSCRRTPPHATCVVWSSSHSSACHLCCLVVVALLRMPPVLSGLRRTPPHATCAVLSCRRTPPHATCVTLSCRKPAVRIERGARREGARRKEGGERTERESGGVHA